MSRQNKAKQKAIIAKQYSEIRKTGGKGPSSTTPKHGKVNTLREVERKARIAAAAKAASTAPNDRPANGRRNSKPATGRSK